jgi:O-antigen ligase
VLVLTQSRGALFGVAIALAAPAGVLARGAIVAPAALRRQGGPIAGVLAVIGALGIGVAFVVAGLQSDRPELLPEQTGGAWYSPSASGRLGLWRDGLALLAEAPITGIGLHNFPIVHGSDPEQGVFVYRGFAHVHNQLLQSALDYGLPGMVAVVGLFVSVGWAVHRIRRHTRGGQLDPLVLGVGMGLLAHVVHGLVDAVAIGAKPGFLPWALAGLIAGLRPRVSAWSAPAPADLGPPPAYRIIGRHTEEHR